MDKYDLCIIGAGGAGAFSVLKIAKEHKNIKTILFDIGRPFLKRRTQVHGAMGCLPSGDGKLYLNDVSLVSEMCGIRKTKSSNNWLNNYMLDMLSMKTIKDRSPHINLIKRIKNSGFDIKLNDYVQLYPKDIHTLSKNIYNTLNNSKNIFLSFDNEVLNIKKQKKTFIITSQEKQIECKRVIICAGRSGWRWARDVFNSFGLIETNDIAKFGIRIEASSTVMKDFNKSNCSITKQNLELGPFCWGGTVIPEDHYDFAISAFRSNEQRWKSDKVSFNLIGNRFFASNGFEQTNRIGQLTFVLANDRIIKEKISTVMSKKSSISIIPEYDWLSEAITDVSQFIPDIIAKGYFHLPTILPLAPKINLGSNLESEVDGLYVAGESTGIIGILGAALTGLIVADAACK
jgi:uncharacterized FAD-dependent dehydrogenase